MKKIFLSLGIILSLGLASCGNKNEVQIAEQSSQIEELEKKVSTLDETAEFNEEEFDFNNEFVGINIVNTSFNSDEHSNLFFVEYTALNHSEEPLQAQQLFFNSVEAYQDGEKLDFGTVSESEKDLYDLAMKLSDDVLPNEEVHTVFIYRFTDTEIPIELRFYENQEHNIEPIKVLTYEVK